MERDVYYFIPYREGARGLTTKGQAEAMRLWTFKDPSVDDHTIHTILLSAFAYDGVTEELRQDLKALVKSDFGRVNTHEPGPTVPGPCTYGVLVWKAALPEMKPGLDWLERPENAIPEHDRGVMKKKIYSR